jgi:hypothetical protein
MNRGSTTCRRKFETRQSKTIYPLHNTCLWYFEQTCSWFSHIHVHVFTPFIRYSDVDWFYYWWSINFSLTFPLMFEVFCLLYLFIYLPFTGRWKCKIKIKNNQIFKLRKCRARLTLKMFHHVTDKRETVYFLMDFSK